MKGYTYIENGRVVVNVNEKPENHPNLLPDNLVFKSVTEAQEHQDDIYYKVLSAWNDSCIEVESSQYEYLESKVVINIAYGKNKNFHTGWQQLSDSQPVSFTLSGKTAVITKIK